MSNIVAICQKNDSKYPSKEEMIYPAENYPEFDGYFEKVAKENSPFKMMRELFLMMELDIENYGRSTWNPLGEYIEPDQTILIKPNLVLDVNEAGGVECLYTQPSVVAAVIPYVVKALGERGQIIIADAPMQECDFDKLIDQSGYSDIVSYYRSKGITISLVDLRGLKTKVVAGVHQQSAVLGKGKLVKLNELSEHASLDSTLLKKDRITNYDPSELSKHHNSHIHEYLVANEALEADVIINMPKPKTHRLAGATISMKNFVGIATRKEYLPHHRIGSVSESGDEYQKKSILLNLNSKILDLKNKHLSNRKYLLAGASLYLGKAISWTDRNLISHEEHRVGAWYGNDTIWRTIVDLNRIALYSDKNGIIKDTVQRKILVIADMIIMGEKEGPCYPSPRDVGILAMGSNTAIFDEAIATIMGFSTKKIPLFSNLKNNDNIPIAVDEAGLIISNNINWNGKNYKEIKRESTLNLTPTSGWKGHIELDTDEK